MDYVLGTAQILSGQDASYVIVDEFTKSMHFLSIRNNQNIGRLGKLYVQEIVKLYEIFFTIKSNRDPRSTF